MYILLGKYFSLLHLSNSFYTVKGILFSISQRRNPFTHFCNTKAKLSTLILNEMTFYPILKRPWLHRLNTVVISCLLRKTSYILIHAPCTHNVVLWNIKNIPQGFHRVKFVIIPHALYSSNICEILLYNRQLVVLNTNMCSSGCSSIPTVKWIPETGVLCRREHIGTL